MNKREEFEKWWQEKLVEGYVAETNQGVEITYYGATKQAAYKVWQAATSSTEAKYQARIKELEEALQNIQATPAPCEPRGVDMQIFNQWKDTVLIARKALSTTAPMVRKTK